MKPGKRFEQNFRDSFRGNTLIERMDDSGGGWEPDLRCHRCGAVIKRKTRFQRKNKPDFFVFYKGRLFIFELKSHKNKSLPIKDIQNHQLEYLQDKSRYNSVIGGLVINMRDVEETYFMEVQLYQEFTKDLDRKSIPLEYLRQYCVPVKSFRKVTNYKYDVYELMNAAIVRSGI